MSNYLTEVSLIHLCPNFWCEIGLKGLLGIAELIGNELVFLIDFENYHVLMVRLQCPQPLCGGPERNETQMYSEVIY